MLLIAKASIFPQYPMRHYVKNTFRSQEYHVDSVFGGN